MLQEGCHQVGLSPMGDPHGSRDTPRGLWPMEVPMPEQRSIKKTELRVAHHRGGEGCV